MGYKCTHTTYLQNNFIWDVTRRSLREEKKQKGLDSREYWEDMSQYLSLHCHIRCLLYLFPSLLQNNMETELQTLLRYHTAYYKCESDLHVPILLQVPYSQQPEVWELQELEREKEREREREMSFAVQACDIIKTKCNWVSQRTWVKSWDLIRRKMVLQQLGISSPIPLNTTYASSRILNKAHSPSLAAVTSLFSLAITRQAASCWYRACDNSIETQPIVTVHYTIRET